MSRAELLAALAGMLAAGAIGELASVRRRRRQRGARLGAALQRLGRRIGAPPAPRDLGRRIAAAGARMTVADAMALKVGTAAVGLLGVLPLSTGAPGRLGLLTAPAGAAAGFIALDLWLRRRARCRKTKMAAELPDVLDLLRVAMQAGLPPMRAFTEVARRHPGLLPKELGRTAAQAALGRPSKDALAELKERAPLPAVAALTAAFERADRLGTPPAEALQALAREAREHRARARSEAAAKAAPKVQLVVALLLVPAVMLIVAAALAPALLSAT